MQKEKAAESGPKQVDSKSTTAITTVQNCELSIVEVEGRRVVTLAMIDQVHQRPRGTARRNFAENRQRFIEGEDYFELTGYEIRTRSLGHVFPSRTFKGILLSEAGYLLLIKSFSDELSWQVQRQLVSGYFRAKSHADLPALLTDPAALRQALLGYADRLLEAAPKVAALDRIAAADGAVCITDTAKTLGVAPRRLFTWLAENRWIYRRGSTQWTAYQPRIEAGLLEHRVVTFRVENGEEWVAGRTLVTPKGIARLAELLAADVATAGGAG